MNATWEPAADDHMYDGDVGGDAQATRSFDRRYYHKELPGSLVTVYFYGVDLRIIDGEATHFHEPPRYAVGIQHELTKCTDPANPGYSESWSDAVYEEDRSRTFTDLDEVTAAARRAAEQYTAARIPWDGVAEDVRDLHIAAIRRSGR